MANAQLQTWADALATADDFVTFVDLLGLCRLIHSHVHLPVGTLESLLELRAAQPLTLGAQQLLDRTLSSYGVRVRQQRRLAERGIELADAHQLVRLHLGQRTQLRLNVRAGVWAPEEDASAGGLVTLTPEGVRGELQQLAITAYRPGKGELVLVRQARVPDKKPQAARGGTGTSVPRRMVVGLMVETDEEAALFYEESSGEGD